jgi:hypothetical protein
LLGTDHDAEWVPIRGRGNSYSKILIPRSLGPEAIILQLAPNAFTIPDTVPTYGRYEVVLKGAMVIEGRVLGSPAFRYVRGNQHPRPLRAGADGATLGSYPSTPTRSPAASPASACPSSPPKRWRAQFNGESHVRRRTGSGECNHTARYRIR